LPPACSTVEWRASLWSSTGVSGQARGVGPHGCVHGCGLGRGRGRGARARAWAWAWCAGLQVGSSCQCLMPQAWIHSRDRPLLHAHLHSVASCCPAAPFPDHFWAGGANAIALYDIANCWVKDVSIRCCAGCGAAVLQRCYGTAALLLLLLPIVLLRCRCKTLECRAACLLLLVLPAAGVAPLDTLHTSFSVLCVGWRGLACRSRWSTQTTASC